jgi:hypothetical protein
MPVLDEGCILVMGSLILDTAIPVKQVDDKRPIR